MSKVQGPRSKVQGPRTPVKPPGHPGGFVAPFKVSFDLPHPPPTTAAIVPFHARSLAIPRRPRRCARVLIDVVDSLLDSAAALHPAPTPASALAAAQSSSFTWGHEPDHRPLTAAALPSGPTFTLNRSAACCPACPVLPVLFCPVFCPVARLLQPRRSRLVSSRLASLRRLALAPSAARFSRCTALH
ncbi:hypothetical protein SNOG_03325 [Parastagonospora nodorum SN15]|uniref:Uncharacterized protein n=1 Tax=Phaeosphaeria nodorum (strain SN15 / ATCC MYA-4574 / FGSC 10173) TaxID=321614 RepID=Q0UY39_PHANO|nr:hypothetical protein SNOG_03325 [Parastagonospora nodorum SN15]EAT90056.1 hypothetical protein SNOG_03325 [Parastagonospora nodorum SN15]